MKYASTWLLPAIVKWATQLLVWFCALFGLILVRKDHFTSVAATVLGTANGLNHYVDRSGAIATAGMKRPRAIARVKDSCALLAQSAFVLASMPVRR